uniref:Uncharacterized protein n=1 Tax=Siphoviridae sp. ct9lR64 TaxID=2826178 RepID=A0A8S5QYG2_9CAUD|nr:MAG TPA: hypothetical protein [Siphoviridae sp. ct9lR64]
MDENKEQEVIDINEEPESTELIDVSDEDYTPSLGESIATLAVLIAPLAISYVAGVVSSDKVKNGIADIRTRIAETAQKRAEKIKLKEARSSKIVKVVYGSDEETEN